jgi:pyrrolidone-carboxylate peptidase
MRHQLIALLALAGLGLSSAVPVLADTGLENCFSTAVPLTAEEQRLSGSVGPQLVQEGGFAPLVEDFRSALCATDSAAGAALAVAGAGEGLWRAAVDRAQGRRAGTGVLDELDDRPLYWARLQMSAALRQWAPVFEVDRDTLHRTLSHTSRGVRSMTAKPGTRTALISGFDPFGFEEDLRLSNPAGSAALRLDGQVIETKDGPVTVEAALFPVGWKDFDEGVVEAAFGPSLTSPGNRLSTMMTISQGAGFTVEQWAAGWRSGQDDNNDLAASGPIPAATGWAQDPSTLIETTLPREAMTTVHTGPRRVSLNKLYCYWPAGTAPGSADSDCRFDGQPPQPGDNGAMGSGGAFLSNESMFRANRLRLGLGAADVSGGHLHVPAVGVPGDPAVVTDEMTKTVRREIVDQTIALIGVAATV